MSTTPKKSPVGYLCTITGKEDLGKAKIRFYGKTKFKEGVWAGLELSTAGGKNDGSVAGERYFTCKQGYGMFVPSTAIQIIPRSGPSAATTVKRATPTRTPKSTTSTPVTTPTTKTETPRKPQPEASTPTAPKESTPKPSTPKVNTPSAVVNITEPLPKPVAISAPKDKVNEKRKEELAAYMSVKALETEIEQLKEECGELKDWKMDAQGTIKELQKEVTKNNANFQKQEEALQSKISTLERESAKAGSQQQREFEKKQSAWAKEKEAFVTQIDELNDKIEDITLDKDLAEETREELEQELDTTKGKLEILELKESTRAISDGTQGQGDAITGLQQENEKLKVALMKLRELCLNEKQENSKTVKELEKENALLPGLEEKNLDLETKLLEIEENYEDIKEQLDVALEAEDMVQDLNDKNLDLRAKMEELQMNLEELEELRDLSEEIEEQQTDEIKTLRKQSHLLEIRILDQETTFDNLHNKFIEQKDVVLKFREKTQELKAKLLEYIENDEEKSIESINLESKIQRLMDENLQLSSQVQKISSAKIENEIFSITSDVATRRYDAVTAYVPTEVFKDDMEAIDCDLLVQQFTRKCVLALENLKEQFDLHDYVVSSSSPKQNEVRYFGFQLIRKLVSISTLLQEIHGRTSVCTDTESWLSFRHMQWDIKAQEHTIDELLHAIKTKAINETYPMDNITKAERIIRGLGKKYNLIPARNLPIESIRNIVYDSQELLLEHQRIQRFVSMALSMDKDANTLSNAEEICKGEEIKERVRILLNPCRKSLKLLQQVEFGATIPDKDVATFQSIANCSATCSEILQTVKQISNKLGEKISDVDSDSKTSEEVHLILKEIIASLQNSNEDSVVVAEENAENEKEEKKQEEIAKPAKEVETWSFIEEILTKLTKSIEKYAESLQNLSIEMTGPELQTGENAFKQRAAKFYDEFNQLNNLKDTLGESMQRLKEKESEVKGLEKSISSGNQIQDILERKVQKLNEKQTALLAEIQAEKEETKRQVKSQEDALISMQGDIDILEKEKSELVERLTLQSKYGAVKGTEERGIKVSLNAVSKEIDSLRCAISYLQEENTTLRAQNSASKMKQLQRLSIVPAKTKISEDITGCRKELRALSQRVLYVNNSPRVLDLATKNSSNQFSDRKSELAILNAKMKDCEDKIQGMVINLPQAATSFGSFPVSPVIPSTSSTLMAKINMPLSPSLRKQLVKMPCSEQRVSLQSSTLRQLNSVVLLGQ